MSEPYTIKMPQLSDTMTEGVLVSWEKQPGDAVQRGDIVATVETDKAIMDVEVFRDGYLSGPLAAVDSVVAVGGPLAYVVAAADQVESGTAAPSATAEPALEPASTEQPEPASTPAAAAPAEQQPDGTVHVIKMPQLSDTMTEGVLVSWDKQAGEAVQRGDIVAQVETDKAIMDVEVFRDGYLSGPMAEVDSVVPVGDPLAYIVAEAEQVVQERRLVAATAGGAAAAAPKDDVVAAPAAAPALGRAPSRGAPAPRPAGKQASPYARSLAGGQGVDLRLLSGTGPGGVIVAADVLRAQPGSAAAPAGSAAPALQEAAVAGDGRPMSALEKAISHAMSGSITMPTFRVTVNARPEALIKAAKQLGISVTVAIARACAVAIGKHPRINWCYQPTDKLVERDQVDIGMAVAADDGGLVVPVLRNCESRDLQALNTDWKELVASARKRRLKPAQFANPTFMVSNMGMLGVAYFDAIPTPGTAAILAISTAGAEGMPLTVTADHRVVNGADVALFLNTLRDLIQTPRDWMPGLGPAIPPGDWDYDVVVIGGGPGGEDCARDLAGHGLRVAMINDAPFPGGECLWRGCIPSKAWRAAADRIRERASDEHLGVKGTQSPRLDWAALEQTRRQVLETRGALALKTDQGVRIKVIHGFGRFTGEHTLFVDQSGNGEDPHRRETPGDGTQGETLRFGCAVIATGAPPFVPPITGAQAGVDNGGVLTSDTVWGLSQVPKRLAIVGAGAIGVEMAQIFQDFGSDVILVEGQPRILAEVEAEVARQLTEVLQAEPRLRIETGAQVTEISGQPGAMQIKFTDAEGIANDVDCDYVLMATGKRPVLDGLQLDQAGVQAQGPVIEADARCRTNVAHIYAVGDVIGGLMLAHTAAQQGRVAAAAILGEDLRYDDALDCGVIFTRPQAAFVGLSAEQAKARGLDVAEVKMPINLDAKAMINNETHGLIKLVADKASERIVGVHFLADHADTLIGEGVMMVAGRMRLTQVAQAIHPHPTQTEMFGDMARRLLSRLRRSRARAQ